MEDFLLAVAYIGLGFIIGFAVRVYLAADEIEAAQSQGYKQGLMNQTPVLTWTVASSKKTIPHGNGFKSAYRHGFERALKMGRKNGDR